MLLSATAGRYIKIAIISLFILLVGVQSGKHFVLDEIDFPIVSHATSLTYKPIYYRGEARTSHVGTYHPTLYINTLAVFIKFFGFSEITVRAFGAICTLVSSYLLLLISRLIVKKVDNLTEIIFLSLFLLNPYTIANTTLPDIDSTILPVTFLLFIYFSLKFVFKNNLSDRVIVILGSLFALCLWTKLTTPLILPVFLVFLINARVGDIKKSLVITSKVVLLGGILFASTYYIYCKILGLSATYTYTFLVDSFTKGTSTSGPVDGAISNLGYLQHFIYWPTVPLVLLILVAAIGLLIPDKKKTIESIATRQLLIISLVVGLFYFALISPFGGFFKYPFPVFGLLVMLVAIFYTSTLPKFKNQQLVWGSSLAIIGGFLIEKKFWGDSMFKTIRPFSSALLLLAISVLLVFLIKHRGTRMVIKYLLLIFCFFTVGFQISISRIQAVSKYSTKYLYGQEGFDQTISYLKTNTEPKDIIWSMKDVGYYANNRYYESYTYYFGNPTLESLTKLIRERKVKYLVASTGIGEDNIEYYKNVKQLLDKYAIKERQFGNFIIYKPKGGTNELK